MIRMIGDDIAHTRKKANAAGLAVQAQRLAYPFKWEKWITAFVLNIVNEGMARQTTQQLRKALS